MANRRPERVASLVHQEISTILLGEARDERLYDAQILSVEMSSDLQIAKVYYELVEGSEPEAVQDAFEHAKPFLRAKVGQRLGLRRVPELRFFYDGSQERGRGIDALLRNLREAGQMGEE